jgi:hypothetical protein
MQTEVLKIIAPRRQKNKDNKKVDHNQTNFDEFLQLDWSEGILVNPRIKKLDEASDE